MPHTVRYGDHPSQYVEAWVPAGRCAGIAVLVHGGWWRARFDRRLMDALCAHVAARGWLAWNVEFRRTEGGDGGWPATLHDVLAAIAAVAQAPVPVSGLPVVGVGHSAGGHLAMLAAGEHALHGAVALAPVTDLVRSAAEGLGEGAVTAFTGDDVDTQREASPRHRPPIGCPLLLVHGDADQRVPVEHSRDHAAAHNVELLEIPGGDHFVVLDPTHDAWRRAFAWARDQAGPSRRR